MLQSQVMKEEGTQEAQEIQLRKTTRKAEKDEVILIFGAVTPRPG